MGEREYWWREAKRAILAVPADLSGGVMTAELIAIIALGGLLTPILLAMHGRLNAVADRLHTLGERVAKVEALIADAGVTGGAALAGPTPSPRRETWQ